MTKREEALKTIAEMITNTKGSEQMEIITKALDLGYSFEEITPFVEIAKKENK